jgi:hypothetical protein
METLEQRVERIERMLKEWQPKKEQWVGPTVITAMTGWSSEDMRRARRNGSITYRRKKSGGYEYLASTIVTKQTA